MQTRIANPVWMLYRRRIASQVSYWLAVLGYNVRDRSFTNRIYLVYFCGFWLIWVLAMFFLIGYSLAGMQDYFTDISPAQVGIIGFTYLLLAWGIIKLWQVARCSPFAFSEADAYLLCRTPINRRQVGMGSFLMESAKTGLIFSAVAVLISFTLAELHPSQSLLSFRLIETIGFGLRSLAIILPLQIALQAFLWSLGAWRLQRTRINSLQGFSWLKLAAPVLLSLVAVSAFFPSLRQAILVPLTFPLGSAFGAEFSARPWLTGFGVSLIYLVAGMLALYFFTNKIYLGQAAEETSRSVAIRQAQAFFSFDLADALRQRDRLAATHPPSRLPARSGKWILLWKDCLQSLRNVRMSSFLKWAVLASWSLVLMFSSSWGLQLLAGCFWAINMGSLATQRLRNDLSRWWILRSLPFPRADVIKMEISLSCLGGILLSWLVLAISGKPFFLCIISGVAIAFMAINSALATAQDILRRSKTRLLLSPSLGEENVPQQSVEGILRTVALNLIPLGWLVWFLADPKQVFPALVADIAAVVVTIIYVRTVPAAYKWIE